MSLINDALKRVKEAQHKTPPSASLGPQLRPIEPDSAPAHHGLGWLLPIALVGVALLTLLLLWELARKENPVAVRAEPSVQDQSAVASERFQSPAGRPETAQLVGSSVHEASALPIGTSTTGGLSPAPSNSSVIASIPNSARASQAQVSPGGSNTAGHTNSGAVQLADAVAQGGNTNPPIAEAQPPKPAPLRLQGIVFSKRPSAVINGKTLFVGDRVREFRVVAITQDTAILVGDGRTNTLSLSEMN